MPLLKELVIKKRNEKVILTLQYLTKESKQ